MEEGFESARPYASAVAMQLSDVDAETRSEAHFNWLKLLNLERCSEFKQQADEFVHLQVGFCEWEMMHLLPEVAQISRIKPFF